MADQFDNNARSPYPDAEIDDPLAELARIIGYERPPEVTTGADETPESSEFDLEAELMRELDVPLAPSADELDSVEADEALDVMLADAGFDQEPEQSFPDADQDSRDDLQIENPVDDAPELDSADFASVEGRSSDALLKTIENEFPVDQAFDEPMVDDDDWALAPDANEQASDQLVIEPESDSADAQEGFEQAAEEQVVFAAPVTSQDADVVEPFGDDVLADMVRFELPADPQSGLNLSDASAAADDVQPEGESDEEALDFEEYLSTELDVFEHEVALAGNRNEIDEAGPVRGAFDNGEVDADAKFDVETALDALNDSTLDDEVAVFDDAAEELLATINGDDVARGGAKSMVDQSNDTSDGWSLDSIEEPASDQLDDDLADMFALPERVVDPLATKADASDDFELDLEQVLADSFNDNDDDWAEPQGRTADQPRADEPVMTSDDWLSAAAPADKLARQDDISDAFQGLMPQNEAQDLEPAPMSGQAMGISSGTGSAGEAQQSDWLDGFETSEQLVEPSSSQSGDSDYYFDAELISESDETVEIVTDIDVPELQHDDPQLLEPDYETEIEREFAGMVERNEPVSDERLGDKLSASFGAGETWSRDATAPHGYEASDDYIALERELGSGGDHTSRTSATTNYDGDGPAEDFYYSDEMADGRSGTDNGSRGPVLAVAVLGLALLAGLGAFGWSMLSGDETSADGGPRIIRADKEPVKVLPENPGGVTVPNQDKAVYDRVAGGTGASTGQPALVNSAEEPVDVVQRTLDPEILPLEGRSDFAGKSEERLSADGTSSEATVNGTSTPVVSPRKVRTMIVKPDGSIVAREVLEPEVPTSADTPQTLAAVTPQIETPGQPAQSPEPFVQRSTDTAAPVQDQPEGAEVPTTEGTVAPVRIVKTQPIRPVANAPVPAGRPADQPVNVVGTVSQGGRVGAAPAASAVPATAAAPQPVAVASAPVAAAPAANPGGYYVQIASQPTAEGAQASWRTLSNRYSSVLGGLSVDIQRADIVGKGVFHRVKVPAGSKDQANALCSRYKAAGGSCFVSR